MGRKAGVGADQEAEIRARIQQRMDTAQLSVRALAAITGDPSRSVQNWLTDATIPAHFVARFAVAVPTSLDWLLTGRGPTEPVEESRAVETLLEVARIVVEAMESGALTYDQMSREPDTDEPLADS
jgi:hypothetical protein